MATTTVALPEILKASASREEIAVAPIGITNAGMVPLAGFQIMLRSAGSERAADIGHELIEKYHQKAIAVALGGSLAPQHAAVLLSLIAGLQMMRQTMGLSASADSKSHSLSRCWGL